jgi:hypothetical protein
MKKNMGGLDRMIRIVIAIVLIVLYFTDQISGITGIILLVLAGIFVLTSLVRVCPLYMPFGLNSCTKKEKA